MSEDRAYQCGNIKCPCETGDFYRHCSVCGDLYLYDEDVPEIPCLPCAYQEKRNERKRIT